MSTKIPPSEQIRQLLEDYLAGGYQCSENLAQVLTFEGFKLLTAARGATGLQLAQQAHPDLIICDLLLPEMDGFELISRLRDDANTADIPIIVVNALVEPEHTARAEKLGVACFLRKPFQLEDLIEAVYQVLGP